MTNVTSISEARFPTTFQITKSVIDGLPYNYAEAVEELTEVNIEGRQPEFPA